MTFPQAVNHAFPCTADGALRATILALARGGGDITSARTVHHLTEAQHITLSQLIDWLDKARTSAFIS
jgi:hypothetical protein